MIDPTTPIEETASGVLHSEVADYLGITIRGIRLTFRDGELVAATADENEDLLQRILSVGDGDSRRLGALEVGMNPRIENPIGYFVMDTKAYGGVTLDIGENRAIGGTNAANFAWGFGVVEPRLTIDGELVLQDRRFVNIED